MEAQSLEMMICNTEDFINKDNTDYHMVVRPVTDIRTYRQQHLQAGSKLVAHVFLCQKLQTDIQGSLPNPDAGSLEVSANLDWFSTIFIVRICCTSL